MFEKAADDAAHPNAIAHPAHAGTQSAHAADDQVNLHSGLRSAIQRHDDVLVQQGIHLGDDAGRAAVTRVLGFARDQPQAAFRQVERCNQQGFVVGMFGVGGQKIEHIVHRAGNFRIGGEQAQVGIDSRRVGVVVSRSQVSIAAGHAIVSRGAPAATACNASSGPPGRGTPALRHLPDRGPSGCWSLHRSGLSIPPPRSLPSSPPRQSARERSANARWCGRASA